MIEKKLKIHLLKKLKNMKFKIFEKMKSFMKKSKMNKKMIKNLEIRRYFKIAREFLL